MKFEIEYGDESKSLAQLEYSDHQHFEATIILNDYLIEQYSKKFKLLIDTLTEEMKPVVIEENATENQQKSIKHRKFVSWESPDSDAKNSMTENRIESCFPSVRKLILTLMEEIKIVVMEKHFFQNRDESFLLNILEIFDYQDFDATVEYQWFFNRNLLYRSGVFTSDFDS